ncbi:Knotted-like MEINOX transcription factor [Trema orientale]|uniref:Knotted-like MEINOX transcription factor n=1 Tax=Trema orientale TaxID=63057 RepID=A0A2P5D4F3_TREOI|nr:Knotted-like MEINOX transcription factor [Trema orientale]
MGENSRDNSTIVSAFEGVAEIENDVFEEDDEEALMKRMISEHPLFELLIETHINCLKVGSGEIDDAVTQTNSLHEANNRYSGTTNINPISPELDNFMEAYCMALNKLKEAVEEPLKDATSFITNMYAQLKDLSVTENAKQTLICSSEK